MESGLQQGCQETELPLEVPAGELSQLQVQVLQPCVSEAEAQELKQVRTVGIYDVHQCGIYDFIIKNSLVLVTCIFIVPFQTSIHHNDFNFLSCIFKMLFSETTNQSPSWF